MGHTCTITNCYQDWNDPYSFFNPAYTAKNEEFETTHVIPGSLGTLLGVWWVESHISASFTRVSAYRHPFVALQDNIHERFVLLYWDGHCCCHRRRKPSTSRRGKYENGSSEGQPARHHALLPRYADSFIRRADGPSIHQRQSNICERPLRFHHRSRRGGYAKRCSLFQRCLLFLSLYLRHQLHVYCHQGFAHTRLTRSDRARIYHKTSASMQVWCTCQGRPGYWRPHDGSLHGAFRRSRRGKWYCSFRFTSGPQLISGLETATRRAGE